MIGLIFDMDGVIVDNHHYHFKSWKIFFEKYGKQIDEDHYKKNINGRTMKAIIRDVFEGEELTDEQARNYGLEKEEIYRDIYRNFLSPTPGLVSFLKNVKNNNLPTIIGTSAPVENVEFTIEGLKLGEYFDDILDERAVSKGKPDPEIYLKCAKGINLPNNQCIVFEDALAGIKAGKSAGSIVVGVATTHKREELTEADYIIDDFSDLDLNTLYELIK